MSIAAYLAELERRHRALEAEIVEARAHPSIDRGVEASQVAAKGRNRPPAELIPAAILWKLQSL
jgi:hypothetical protein